ncbi:hypothetical protein AOQ84DRAFT_380115 [Glonium stellatum]|uniref:Uncharacterized protein n=1 Tax=Glonium stellatum TaxID=574774 RepID=A0A8E2EUM9_9PEZI|nr:hypothetical protein AOQ84DRAFT_380115 [Glonium stellatum]
MRLLQRITLLLTASTVTAISLPSLSTNFLITAKRGLFALIARRTSRPPVWKYVTTELTTMFSGFLGTNCIGDALAAIRAAFHDCFPGDGGCDGSLILAQKQ